MTNTHAVEKHKVRVGRFIMSWISCLPNVSLGKNWLSRCWWVASTTSCDEPWTCSVKPANAHKNHSLKVQFKKQCFKISKPLSFKLITTFMSTMLLHSRIHDFCFASVMYKATPLLVINPKTTGIHYVPLMSVSISCLFNCLPSSNEDKTGSEGISNFLTVITRRVVPIGRLPLTSCSTDNCNYSLLYPKLYNKDPDLPTGSLWVIYNCELR